MRSRFIKLSSRGGVFTTLDARADANLGAGAVAVEYEVTFLFTLSPCICYDVCRNHNTAWRSRQAQRRAGPV